MKKSDFHQNINRNNNTIFSHLSQQSINDIQNVHFDQIWLKDDQVTTGVQIIELNSSEDLISSPDSERPRRNGAPEHPQEGLQTEYQLNANARERRRRKLKDSEYDDFKYLENNNDNSFYPEFYELGNTNLNHDDIIFNQHHMNCFSFLDRPYVGSDSSNDVDYVQDQDIHDNSAQPYDLNNSDEIAKYETDMDGEKRTIWIYSFKNKRLLSEDTYELVNIPSRDATSSSCSVEETDLFDTETRLGTPVPNTYVPRLNLTATLPTVAEETIKATSGTQTERLIKKLTVNPKPLNNWFMSENATPKPFPPATDRSTSIVNWMALSPRERRQYHTKSSPIPRFTKLPIVPEFVNNVEDKMDAKVSARKPVVEQDDLVTKAVIEHKTIATNTEDEYTIQEIEEPITVEHKTEITQIIEVESDIECLPEDRGDYDSHRYQKMAHIRLGRKVVKKSDITDPIEKLDSDNWIIEEPLETAEDRRTRGMRGDCVSERLYKKNMCLLKPAEWTEFYPVSGSIPSLHLSIKTDSEIRSESWLKRLVRCFHCFK